MSDIYNSRRTGGMPNKASTRQRPRTTDVRSGSTAAPRDNENKRVQATRTRIVSKGGRLIIAES